jgi:putative ABC transport system permease protein
MRWWQIKKRNADLERELRSDLELEEEEQRENGLPPQEARYAAQRALGNMHLIKDRTREVWGWLWLEWLLKDIRYAVRGLLRSPVFTVVAVLSLALGVGVITGVFGVFEAVFLNAVSARNIGQLRQIEPGDSAVSYRYYQYLSSANDPAIIGLAAYTQSGFSFHSGDDLESITGDIVSPNFFNVLGVTPAIGRAFSIDEQQPEHQPQVVIVSHNFWEHKCGANPDILGTVIDLNREAFTVIGVLPKDYRSIHGYGMAPDIYVPFSRQLLGDLDDPSLGTLQLIARVQDGFTVPQLKLSLGTIVQSWRQLYPKDKRYSDKVEVYPLTGIEKMRRDGVPLELTIFFALLILIATYQSQVTHPHSHRSKLSVLSGTANMAAWVKSRCRQSIGLFRSSTGH